MSDIKARSVGRQRSERCKIAILEATRALLAQGCLRDLSIEAIADTAGVSKATIYRWWRTKGELALEACLGDLLKTTRFSDKGTVCDRICNQVRRLIAAYAGPTGKIMSQLLAEGQFERSLLESFRRHHVEKRRDEIARLVGGTDEERAFLCDMIYGPIYFRLMFGHAKLDQDFSDRLIAEIRRQMAFWTATHGGADGAA